jgi:hypothetical protein
MALTKCPDCGKDVSQEAWSCPGCGKPFRNPLGFVSTKIVKRALAIWMVLIFAFVVLWQVLDRQAR